MDPVTLGLGLGLITVFGKLVEWAADITLDKSLELLIINYGGEEAKYREALGKAFDSALEAARKATDARVGTRLGRALNKIKDSRSLAVRVAAAVVVEMVNEDPHNVPADLLSELDLTDNERPALARFLSILRRQLAGVDGYGAGIEYADKLHERGLLTGIYQNVAALASTITDTTAGRALRVQPVTPTEHDYLRRVVERFKYLELFGRDEHGPMAEKIWLSNIYIALNTTSTRQRPLSEEEIRELNKYPASVRLADDPGGPEFPAFLDKGTRALPLSALRAACDTSRLVILGEPGAGKSTFVQHLSLCLAGACLGERGAVEGLRAGPEEDPDQWPSPYPLPIFIKLRDLAADFDVLPAGQPGGADSVLAYLEKELSKPTVGLAGALPVLRQRLESGEAVVVFDGFDEVAHPAPEGDPTEADLERRLKVKQAITDISRCYPLARVVVTCRVQVYPPEGSRKPEHHWRLDFPTVELQRDLDDGQIEAFVQNWYAEIQRRRRLDADKDPAALGQDLWVQLQTREQLMMLARKPILLTQITLIHAREPLPRSRVELYTKCAELLLWEWESLRAQQTGNETAEMFVKRIGQASGLGQITRDTLRSALEQVVFEAHAENLVQIQEDFIRSHLVSALRDMFPGLLELKADNIARAFIFEWLRQRNGLLLPAGERAFDVPHRSFREFLAARHLVKGNSETEEEWYDYAPELTIGDADKWREVFQFTAGLEGNPRNVARAVDQLCPDDLVPHPNYVRRILLGARVLVEADLGAVRGAGKIGRDVTARLERLLRHTLRDTNPDTGDYPDDRPHQPPLHTPEFRAAAGDLLNDFTWTPPDLYDLIPIRSPSPAQGRPKGGAGGEGRYWIAKYPVTNLQYARFLADADYADPELWKSIAAFDAEGKPQPRSVGDEAWDWFQKAGQDGRPEPGYWNDARIGKSRRLCPVVTVTWYEAAAYCAWLTRRLRAGDESIDEVRALQSLITNSQSLVFRLPLEREWELAAGGVWPEARVEEETPRYPWQTMPAEMTDEEIQRHANTAASGFNTTSPVCMFPTGASPSGVMDMAGNVWEWQANLWKEGQPFRSVRGGAWSFRHDFARVGVRNGLDPDVRFVSFGLRVVASPG